MTDEQRPDGTVTPDYAKVTRAPSKRLALATLVCGLIVLATTLLALLWDSRNPLLGGGLALLALTSLLYATVTGIPVLVTRRPGKGLAALGLIVAWTTAATVFLLPHEGRARRIPPEEICRNRLKGIGNGIAMYQAENTDAFPPDLTALVDEFHVDEKQLVCPVKGSVGIHYFYVPRPTPRPGAGVDPHQSRTVLACDFKDNHAAGPLGRNVLFLDGHVDMLDEPAFQALLAQGENAAFAAALRAAEGP